MKPILFDKDVTEFNTNGKGRLDPLSCILTEERNGAYELELSVAEGSSHVDELELNSIIGVIPAESNKIQAFRVYKITKPINGIFTVYAQHISYQLSMIPTMPFSVEASASACQTAMNRLKFFAAETCPFSFNTDVTTVNSYTQSVPASIRSRLGGVSGSILEQFGGEYEWDNYKVYLRRNRGVSTPTVTLRYGKNITDLNQEENIAQTITGICPYWADSEGHVVTLPENVIESAYADNYPFRRTVPYDFSSAFKEQPTVAELRTKAQAYVNQAGIGVPEVSIKVSFIALWQTEEYKRVAPLEHVKLCDTVAIEFEKYGISTTAKVIKTTYDVLNERYTSIELGQNRSSLAATIANQANETAIKFGEISNEIGHALDNATNWLTSSNGYVVAVRNSDGSWKELLFLDTNDASTATNVLRINENGIGFSRNGVNGPYTQAWTLDGKLTIGGTNVPSLTVYDSGGNIIFKASASAIQWNTTNSSMDANGIITMKNGIINQFDSNNNFIKQRAANISFGVNGTEVGTLCPGVSGNDQGIMLTGQNTYLRAVNNIKVLSQYDDVTLDSAGDISLLTVNGNGDIKIHGGIKVSVGSQQRPEYKDGLSTSFAFYDYHANRHILTFYKGILTNAT